MKRAYPIPYGKQEITESDIKAVIQTLQSDFLTQGPSVSAFESAFAAYVGSNYAVAVSNGTAALHLSAMALDVNRASRVITTPITFVASANCVLYCGGHVDFVDIDPATATMDIGQLQRKLESSPKGTYSGIIPVDFAGYPVNLEEIRKLADEFGCWIIEDACHAPGAFFSSTNGVRQYCGSGTWADLSVFSFHPVKHIACGEGGMITTNDRALYDKLLLLRTHGITKQPSLLNEAHGGWYYEMQALGYNYRLTDFQSALGLSQLQRAEAGLSRRREIAAIYDAAFADNQAVTPLAKEINGGHAYHLYVIRTQQRAALYNYLREYNILTQVHYIPVHLQPFYRQMGFNKGDFPQAEQYYEECLSLPMYPSLTREEQEEVIGYVNRFANK